MRWKEPQFGQPTKKRIRKGFLFMPRTIDGETRWLEWAKWWQESRVAGTSMMGEPAHDLYETWDDTEWIDPILRTEPPKGGRG